MRGAPLAFLLILLAILPPRPGFGATITLCPDDEGQAVAGVRSVPFYSAEGARVRLELRDVDSEASPVAGGVETSCTGAQDVGVLPVTVSEVLWIGPANVRGVDVARLPVALQGSFTADAVSVSEVHWEAESQASAGVVAGPFGMLDRDLLTVSTATVFGAEGRARFAGTTLSCGPGSAPAGVLLKFPRALPTAVPLRLEIKAEGRGRFGVAVSDEIALNNEAPRPVGAFRATSGGKVTSLRLPAHREGWRAVTLTCPVDEGRLALAKLSVTVEARDVPPPPRSAWIWSPAAWTTLEGRSMLWTHVRRERLSALYLTVPVDGSVVHEPRQLAGFIEEAAARGVSVWAVAGDPHDVLPAARPALLARAEAYAAYNAAVPVTQRLAGLQLDIEPYLLPGFALAPGYWRERYLETFRAVRDTLRGRAPLDLVVPVWWGTHPEWGERFLHGIAAPGVSLTVMNYRTQLEALRAGAQPFLDAGERFGYKVRMGLETGPLPDEQRRIYHPAPAGAPATLWLQDQGAMPFLVLLATPRADLTGVPYAFTRETVAPASNLTFGRERPRREDVLRMLAIEWSAWTSFAGVALHGLDAQP